MLVLLLRITRALDSRGWWGPRKRDLSVARGSSHNRPRQNYGGTVLPHCGNAAPVALAGPFLEEMDVWAHKKTHRPLLELWSLAPIFSASFNLNAVLCVARDGASSRPYFAQSTGKCSFCEA